MKTETLIRWSGVAAIIAGIVGAAASFVTPEAGSPLEWVFFLGWIATLFGFMGIYAHQAAGSGSLGALGFALLVVGTAYFLAGEPSLGGMEATVLLALFGSVYSLGLVLLAVGTLKARKLPRWVAILWIVAVVVGLPGAFVPSLAALAYQLGAVAGGLAFVGAGYTLWSRPRAPAS